MGKQAAAIGAELRKQIALAVKAFVLELDKRLRKYTPVDTGWARANWVPSVGNPYTGVIEVQTKVGGRAGSSEHAAGVAAVVSYDLSKGAIWITNNVPYIDALNYGHSSQAPAGWIERAIDEALQVINQKLKVRIVIDPFSTASKYGRDQLAATMAENLASAYSPFGDD